MGNLDIHHGTQNESDIAERVFAQIEHTQSHENHMDRVTHPLEICLAEQIGHGWSGNSGRLWNNQRVITLLVTAGIAGVMLLVVVQIHRFPAERAGWIVLRSSVNTFRSIWRPLMATFLAQILLVSMRIFSITIKVSFVVAFRAAYLV